MRTGKNSTNHSRTSDNTLILSLIHICYNDGASNKVGEGHGDFVLYDKDGNSKFPALRKIAADLLFKWQGWSIMAEYVNACLLYTSTRLSVVK